MRWLVTIRGCLYNAPRVAMSKEPLSTNRGRSDAKTHLIRNSTAEFLIFSVRNGEDGIEVRYEDQSIWLSQKLMGELFDVNVRTISEHLQNIFASNELQQDSVVRKFRNTASDGKQYNTQFYNLDAIISVGYRVNSKRATQFRQWATQVLREFAIKGYVLELCRIVFSRAISIGKSNVWPARSCPTPKILSLTKGKRAQLRSRRWLAEYVLLVQALAELSPGGY